MDEAMLNHVGQNLDASFEATFGIGNPAAGAS